MSDQPSKATSPIVCYGLTVYLIGSFLWRVFIPAHEYAGTSTVYLGIAVDELAIVGLIAIRAGIPNALFWIALVAGGVWAGVAISNKRKQNQVGYRR